MEDTLFNSIKPMQESEILTEALGKADMLFGMRKMLQQYGIPCTEPMVISLKFADKEIETKKFPRMPKPVKVASTEEDIKTAITDILNKANIMYDFIEKIGASKGKNPIKVSFKYGEALNNEVAITLDLCCFPCPLNPAVSCCFC
ncbi:MAG TPA: hypothetical protein ACFCUY_10875 [Xenococcaceae cyanobacterium]